MSHTAVASFVASAHTLKGIRKRGRRESGESARKGGEVGESFVMLRSK